MGESAAMSNTPNNQTSENEKRSKNRKLTFALLCLAVIFALGLGLRWLFVGRYIESTEDAYVGGNVTDLVSRVSGLITAVAVSDNQAVHAGDLLVQIDDRDYQARLAKAKAAVASAQASLSNIDATRTLQLSLINEAQADVVSTAAQSQLAGFNQARYRRLLASKAASLEASQEADAALAQAQAAEAKAHAALLAAQAELSVIDTRKLEAEAALAAAQADLATATLNEGYTEIRAPIDGVVGNRSAHLGGYAVQGGQLLTIVPAAGLWVDANFKEDQLARIRPGQDVTITADILPNKVIKGQVASIAPASGEVFSILPAENATGNFTKVVQRVPVRIKLDSDADRLGILRPGLSVTASIDTK
ncbi:MAG: hemolysin D [Acidocella sp. 20-57-95]|nr:MAG: hemolysin D [Acidocella sp. 20-57-95]OYV56650.1 MAG: hemolysin D [Acidocella sp. 21-58-7]HQT64783.1 HlyD family secretion protein [Acidocella sp.]